MADDQDNGSAPLDGRQPPGGAADDAPAGGAYEWLQRGMALLAQGNAAAAATLLERVRVEDPTSAAVLEALARARYDAGQYELARTAFTELVETAPDSDYAHFGLGLCLLRLGRIDDAEPHLALAVVMRPGRAEYSQRLREVRATRAARRGAAASPAADTSAGGDGTGGTPDTGGLGDQRDRVGGDAPTAADSRHVEPDGRQ